MLVTGLHMCLCRETEHSINGSQKIIQTLCLENYLCKAFEDNYINVVLSLGKINKTKQQQKTPKNPQNTQTYKNKQKTHKPNKTKNK